jgi:SM-20-related protein
MPNSAFFRSLGLFVVDSFLGTEECRLVCAEISAAIQSQGTIINDGSEHDYVDESVRKVSCAKVSTPVFALVESRLEEITPRIQEHFQMSLADQEGLQFLSYGPGGFFAAHRDADSDRPTSERQVSIVIFLNSKSKDSTSCGYDGGALTFYGLMGGDWEKLPLPLDAQPGLLVAFRSNILHEVAPVTFGQRFTIVSWLKADASERSEVLKKGDRST